MPYGPTFFSSGRILPTLGLILGLTMLFAIACASSSNETSTPDQSGGGSQAAQTAGSTSSTDSMTPGSSGTAMTIDKSEYASLSGDISIDGSSTVFPITEAVAEEFGILAKGNVRVTVGISGTGGGFKKFCNSEIDISDASRPVKANEVNLCADAGIEFIEIPVAIDGLTVMVHPGNDFAQCMTIDELHTVWGPDSEDKITNWNQIRDGWPDQRLDLYAPGVDSGTFDYFTETVNGESQASRGDFTASEDDNVLVQGISGDRGSLGYFGYAYYAENTNRLKSVAIDGGNGCVTPTDETINNGTYAPLSRPLFIYVRRDSAEIPHVRAFVEYFLSAEGRQLVAEVGYIPFPDDVYDLALARFHNGATGTLFGGENPKKGPVAMVLAGG